MTTYRHIRQQWSLVNVNYRLVDAIAVVGGLLTVVYYAYASYNLEAWMLIGAVAICIFSMVAEFTGMYRSWRGVLAEREWIFSWVTWGLALLLLLALGWLTLALQNNQAFTCWLELIQASVRGGS